jgi:hypothetical protein
MDYCNPKWVVVRVMYGTDELDTMLQESKLLMGPFDTAEKALDWIVENDHLTGVMYVAPIHIPDQGD